MRRVFCWLLLGSVVACVQQKVTPAIVTRMVDAPRGRTLWGCTVILNWTEAEMIQACGKPDEYVEWAGHQKYQGNCALYRTGARPFGLGQGANLIAACMELLPWGDNPTRRVTEVFGLDADSARPPSAR